VTGPAAASERGAPAVKFCGLARADDAAEGARLGARYLGAIFAGGPRLVTPDTAAALFSAGRAAAALASQSLPKCVGVVADQPGDELARLVSEAGLDVVQLHADPTPEDVARARAATGREVWAALRVAGAELPGAAAELFAVADAVVLDAKVAGRLGGTGVALEWDALGEALAATRGRARLVLAGGLTPANVRAAAEALGPDVVDVSSGVEGAPGRKDHQLMRAFAAGAASAVTRGRAGREEAS
jgi:phosphoribosylanthranilate isomerase